MQELAPEIKVSIFTLLPFEASLNASQVCKEWRDLIRKSSNSLWRRFCINEIEKLRELVFEKTKSPPKRNNNHHDPIVRWPLYRLDEFEKMWDILQDPANEYQRNWRRLFWRITRHKGRSKRGTNSILMYGKLSSALNNLFNSFVIKSDVVLFGLSGVGIGTFRRVLSTGGNSPLGKRNTSHFNQTSDESPDGTYITLKIEDSLFTIPEPVAFSVPRTSYLSFAGIEKKNLKKVAPYTKHPSIDLKDPAFLFIYDITDLESFQFVSNQIAKLKESELANSQIMIIGNKYDLASKRRKVSKDQLQSLAEAYNCPHMEVAAIWDEGIIEAFAKLVLILHKLQLEQKPHVKIEIQQTKQKSCILV